jgi:hypothetical protein
MHNWGAFRLRKGVAPGLQPRVLWYDNRPPRIRVGGHEVEVGSLTYTADDLKLLLE